MTTATHAPQTLTHYGPSGDPYEYRPNKFGNKCALGCGTYVPGGEGELLGSKAAGWKVQHLPGMCPVIQTPGELIAVQAELAAQGVIPYSATASLPHTAKFDGVTNTLPALPAKPYQPAPKLAVKVTVGVFKLDSDIYVVKPAWKGSTKLYAWRLVESAPRVTLAGTVIPFRLVKSYGAIYKLTEAMRLTMADANEISELYGKCICCARALYAADTIQKCKQTGIWVGPDCRTTYFPQSV